MARVRFVLVVILLGVIVLFTGGVTPAHAISCGDVLGPGGNFKLRQDLDCSGRSRALTVRDGAILDLNGHSVICGDPGPCLELSGAGSQLLDGTLQGGLHDKLIITGSGHTVKNVTSTPIDGNVFIDGDNNRLINVMAGSGLNAAFGIGIRGNNNEISDSIAQCSSLVFGQCIFVSGDSNRLIDNFIVFFNSLDPFQAGLTISGNYNVVRRNRIVNSDGNGIVVTGTGNDLRHNTALLNSPFDLKDTNGDCVHNTWRFNTFRTGDPACIQ